MKTNSPVGLFFTDTGIHLVLIVFAWVAATEFQASAQTGTNQSAPASATPPAEDAVILTPRPTPQPRINGAKVFGVRPGNPFFYTIAATGDRPMTFSAKGLPSGLKLEAKTGRITGKLKKAGNYTVTLRAKNKLGKTECSFKIVCGAQIGLTPALGWNSWNCFGASVTAEHVKAAADGMVMTNSYGRLIDHGWTYVNIDDYWEVHARRTNDPSLLGPQRDAEGRILSNPRFPDMKWMVDYIHGKGLKAGIYSSPGPTTCGGCIGSWQHEEQDAQRYGEWGFDYLKYDWCSYSAVAYGTNTTGRRLGQQDFDRNALMKPYKVMRAALDKVPRDIIFSLCQYGWGNVWEWGAEVGGNSWRTTGDITDNWRSLSGNGFKLGGHEKFVGPGHFDDPDMLIVGVLAVASGRNLHPTRLTPNEQYTHISLWCLLTSPLLIGCDMTRLDDFTLNLLSNDEVLEVVQDPLCRQASRVMQDTDKQIEIWVKPMEDGSRTIGLFNRSDSETGMTAKWSDLGLTGKQKARDLWRQKDLGNFADQFETPVPRHGVVLIRVWPAK